MNKRLMTVEDLYNFCLKNNFEKFESENEIVVQMPATFDKEANEDKDTEGLVPFVSKAFHDHINLNKTEIKEEDFVNNLSSANCRPILAHIVTNEDGTKDFGSHDYHIDEDGNLIYEEQPVGVIYGEQSVEYDEEAKVNRAIVKGYIFGEYCSDVVEILERRGTVNCSVELSVRSMSFNAQDKVLVLNDYYVSGLTLLNENVKPGMAGSEFKLEDFSAKNNSIVENIDEQLVKALNSLNETLMRFDIDNTARKEDNELTNEENITEVVEESEVIEEPEVITESEVAEVEEPEVTEEAEVAEEPEVTEETEATEEAEVTETVEVSDYTKTFSLSHEDVRSSLYNLLAQYEEADNDMYIITSVYDDKFIYQSWFGSNIFGQAYSVEDSTVSFVGERYSLFAEYLTESEKNVVEEMRKNYSSLVSKLENYELEPKKLEVLNSEVYSSISETEEFIELKKQDNHFDMSLEELTAKADEILLAFAKTATFASEANETIVAHPMYATKKIKGRYGNIFHK